MNTTSNNPTFLSQSASFDTKKFLNLVLRNWWFPVLCILVSLCIAFLYLRFTEPLYSSSASIIMKDQKSNSMDPLISQLVPNNGNNVIENEMEVLKSVDLMEGVVMQNKLYMLAKQNGRIRDQAITVDDLPVVIEVAKPYTVRVPTKFVLTAKNNKYTVQPGNNTRAVPVEMEQWYNIGDVNLQFHARSGVISSGPEEVSFTIVVNPVTMMARRYASRISVTPFTKTATIITLALTDESPARATGVLQTLIELYTKQALENKNKVSANTVRFLDERLAILGQELRNVEGSIANFKLTHRITSVPTVGSRLESRVQTTFDDRAQQQMKLNMITLMENELIKNQDNPQLMPANFGINEGGLSGLIARHNDLYQQKESLLARSGPDNPGVKDYENQIRTVRSAMIEEVKNVKATYNLTLNDIARKEATAQSQFGTVPAMEKDLLDIQRDQSVQQALYSFLLQKREETAITLSANTPDSRILQKPMSLGQVAPDSRKIWSMSTIAGLMLPLTFFLLVYFLDNKVSTRKEVETRTVVPLLGIIAHVKNLDNPIQVSKHSRSNVSEQIRAIRTAISYTGRNKPVRSILVTSQRSGEGKSFTSLNLAASYALLDKKVVILEFDLRKPNLARAIGIEARTGISSFLSRNNANLETLLVEVPNTNGNLFLLPAGPVPPNPAELILGSNMKLMMNELSQMFDYIVIDTPPFSLVTDATLLQDYADISIYVLRESFSQKEVYEELNQRSYQFPDLPMYTILNGVGKRKNYYGYGYGYGYYTEDTKNENISANGTPSKPKGAGISTAL